jgi:hypothetical protein
MVPGQLTIQLGLQPLAGFMVLAIRAMAVAAATVNHMVFAALGALIDRSAVMTRAAFDDGIDDFAMISGHVATKALDIFRPEGGKDIFNRRHGHLLSSDR